MKEFKFEMEPKGPFEAGSYTTIKFWIEIGSPGIKPGGYVKIATPNMGWGQPLCPTPHFWDELLIGEDRKHNPWKPINTKWRLQTNGNATIRLRADENILVPFEGFSVPIKPIYHLKQWRWWITATVERDELKEGDVLEIIYGDTEDEPFGIKVQPWPEKNMLFGALVDPKGTKEIIECKGSPISVEVIPGKAEKNVIVVPSILKEGEKANIKISLLDRNLCPPREIEKVEGYLSLKEQKGIIIKDKKIVIPAITEMEALKEGIYHIQVIAKEESKSNPCIVKKDIRYKLYWGDLHAQSMYHQWDPNINRGDSCLSPKELHQYAKECTFLDFVAITDGGGAYESNPGWGETQIAANECYEPHRYVSFKGWECGMGTQGDKCVIYRSAEIEGYIPHMNSIKGNKTQAEALIHFYKNHKERVLTIPHSFMKYLDWSVIDKELDRVMEIYSCWGSYESRTDNPLNTKRKPKKQSAQYVWKTGHIIGVTAAGDSHLGYPGRSLPYADRYWCQCFKAGLCGVYAKELTREAIWDSLYDRRCYGTTGVRIILEFEINNHIMGSLLEYTEKQKELYERSIKVLVIGTDFIRRVDILKNNSVLKRIIPESDRCEVYFCDYCENPLTMDWYYVRVFQADGNAAWSSPIWIRKEGVCKPTYTEIE